MPVLCCPFFEKSLYGFFEFGVEADEASAVFKYQNVFLRILVVQIYPLQIGQQCRTETRAPKEKLKNSNLHIWICPV